tara:strand:+ start:98757 stop:98948 length:192 start_codon:yes stop_codon:yes gene_type:complete
VLPDHYPERLRMTKSKSREAIAVRRLADLEDYRLAAAVLLRVRDGREQTHYAADVRKALGLND